MYDYETGQIDRVIAAETDRLARLRERGDNPYTEDEPLYKMTITAAHTTEGSTKTLNLGSYELAAIREVFARREK